MTRRAAPDSGKQLRQFPLSAQGHRTRQSKIRRKLYAVSSSYRRLLFLPGRWVAPTAVDFSLTPFHCKQKRILIHRQRQTAHTDRIVMALVMAGLMGIELISPTPFAP